MIGERRKYIIIALLVLIIICVSFILFIFIKPDTNNLIEVIGIVISSALGVVSLYFVVSEYKRARNIEEGQFITSLNNQFINNQDIKEVFNKLYLENKDSSLNIFTEDDIPKIVSYLTFLETFWTMYERSIINISMVNDLFANRFFMMITNKNIQKLRLVSEYEIYNNIRKLEHVWRKYRNEKKLKNLYPESSLNKAIALKVAKDSFYIDKSKCRFDFVILDDKDLEAVMALQDKIIEGLSKKEILYRTNKESYSKILRDGNNISLGVKLDDNLIGYCFFTFPNKDFYVYRKSHIFYRLLKNNMYFKVVVVAEEHRKQGIHSAFLHMAKNYAKNYGVKRIIATVHPENGISCHVFEKSGFILKKVRKVHNNEIRNIYQYNI